MTQEELEKLMQKRKAAIDGGTATAQDYSDVAQGYINQYYNDDFKYDINTDELYKQYQSQYKRNAQNAMKDSMAKATGLTGGYASSYAQKVGQQAYDNTMQGLTDMIPNLYQLAQNRFDADRNRKMEQAQYYQGIADNMNEQAKYGNYDTYFASDTVKADRGKRFGTWELNGMKDYYNESNGDFDAFKAKVLQEFGEGKKYNKHYSDEDIKYLYRYAQDQANSDIKKAEEKANEKRLSNVKILLEDYKGKSDDEIFQLVSGFQELNDDEQYELYLDLLKRRDKNAF